MTAGEAKLRLLAEWRTWIGHLKTTGIHTVKDASDFVAYIEKNHADLLSFEGGENKTDVVKGCCNLPA